MSKEAAAKSRLQVIKENLSDSLNRSGVMHGVSSIINAKHQVNSKKN